MNGYKTPLIHSGNKAEIIYDESAHRIKRNAIVMGDIVEDATMIRDAKHGTVLVLVFVCLVFVPSPQRRKVVEKIGCRIVETPDGARIQRPAPHQVVGTGGGTWVASAVAGSVAERTYEARHD